MAEKPNGRIDDATEQPPAAVIGVDAEDVYRDDGDTGDSIPIVDPPTGSAAQREPEPKRRGRGRPRGSTASTSSNTKQAKAATDLTALLMSAHMLLAHVAKIEELNLEEKEAKRLSDAVNRIQDLYEAPILTEKQLAWINLGMTGAALYGPRWAAYSMRMKKEAAEKPPTINAQGFKVM